MSTKIESLDNAVVTCESIMAKVRIIEGSINDLEGQREHNATMGNWTLVKACKEQIGRLQRDKNILGKVLEDAEQR